MTDDKITNADTTNDNATETSVDQTISTDQVSTSESESGMTPKLNDTTREQLKEIATHLEPLVQQTNDTGLQHEWERIQTLFYSASFTVTVAGAFCRGKSSLLNRLLETELPSGDLPTTTLLTSIQYGPQKRLWFCSPNSDDTYSINEVEAFEESGDAESENAKSGSYLYQIPLHWLEEKQLEFVDTPGMDDTDTLREQLAADAIRSADGVLIALGATTPLSLSERTYIEEHIYAAKVPRVAVVITMIDRIPAKERASLVENIRYRVQSLYPTVDVWLADGYTPLEPGEYSVPVGVDYIRSEIDRWASDPDHYTVRNAQIKAQLNHVTELVTACFQTQLDCAEKSQEEKKEIQKSLRRNLDAESLKWNDIELEMDQRSDKAGNVLREQLQSYESEMIGELQKQLDATTNSGIWWEKEFPFYVSREFGEVASRVGNSMRLLVERDFQWLNETARKESDKWSSFKEEGKFSLDTNTGIAFPEPSSISNLQSNQMMKRIGFAVAGTGAFMFFGPIGPILAATGAYISERNYQEATAQQKENIRREIANFVPYLFHKILTDARQSLQDKYHEAVRHVRAAKKEWYRVQLDAIKTEAKKDSNDDETRQLQKQLDEINSLHTALSQMN